VQALEDEATGAVDRQHPQVRASGKARVTGAQRARDRGEDHLDAETEDTVGKKAPHASRWRTPPRGRIRESADVA
jgi:hypothetical protein